MKKIILVGGGYNFSEINPIIKSLKNGKKYKIAGILDDDKKFFKKNYKGLPFYVGLETASKFKDHEFIFAISSYKYSHNREKIFKKMNIDKKKFPNIVHKSVILEDDVKIGYGNIIYPYSIVCSKTIIKDFCTITHHSILAHNVELNSFSVLGSRSTILNNTKVGKSVFFGANVTIGENLKIGNKSKIIMGSVLTKNLGNNKIAIGNPAKIYDNNI